jgi:hypothetical protein
MIAQHVSYYYKGAVFSKTFAMVQQAVFKPRCGLINRVRIRGNAA